MSLLKTTPKIIIFTDLDGTLLDPGTYNFEQAEPALDLIRIKGIPLILSTSKTRAEIELYRRKLGNKHPFISENGGAVFIPKGYFSFPFPYDRDFDEYRVFELGTPYPRIVEVLDSVKKETGIIIQGFFDLTEQDLVSLTGLNLEEAVFAKKREYDEAFMVEGGKQASEIVKRKIEERGLRYAWGGKFHHILGRNDKGKAVKILKGLYEKRYFPILSIGLGDSLNDLPMLAEVDYPIFLKGEKEILPEGLTEIQHVSIIQGAGPHAWNGAIWSLFGELEILGP